MEGVPPPMLGRYFIAEGGRYRVVPWLRDRIRWERADIFSVPDTTGLDLVLCRNVAIYLAPDACLALWRKVEGWLRPGGILVTGKAERPSPHGKFDRLDACVFRKMGWTDVA